MTWHSKPNVGIKYGFRSGLEARVAQELKAQGICYTYEEQQIKYTKPQRESTYTPDFVIGKLIIETKGRFMVADRQKQLDIRFVFSNPKQKISKTSKTSYAMWCEKHGFLYAKESIPQQWLKEAQPS